jgi:hypothetical protein
MSRAAGGDRPGAAAVSASRLAGTYLFSIGYQRSVSPVWPHGQDPAEKFWRAASASMAALTSAGSCSRSLAKQSASWSRRRTMLSIDALNEEARSQPDDNLVAGECSMTIGVACTCVRI